MSTAFDECKDNDRPWESPGAVRRDCEPHRAHLVNLLGALSMACGIGSLCLGITGIAGLILGITACCLATSDLRKMSAGLMDSSGLAETQVGHERGTAGVFCSIAFGGSWGLLALTGVLR